MIRKLKKEYMDKKNNWKAWLYLLPALILLIIFMLYPLEDVFVYAFEENYTFVEKTYTGVGFENFGHLFLDDAAKFYWDSEFLTAVKNTFIIVFITVTISTIISLLIAVGLNAIKPLRKLFETIFFLPYVTNTLAVGLVFMIMFNKSGSNVGLINNFLGWFGVNPIDWIDGSYGSKMFVLCFYVIWNVMPFKILVLIGAITSVRKQYYDAAMIDHASKWTTFRHITVPMISPMISYLVITGFIGAFKEYNNAVAIFGADLKGAEMNTIVGYIYDKLYVDGLGYVSYAAAGAVILFIIIMTITAINLLVSKKHTYY